MSTRKHWRGPPRRPRGPDLRLGKLKSADFGECTMQCTHRIRLVPTCRLRGKPDIAVTEPADFHWDGFDRYLTSPPTISPASVRPGHWPTSRPRLSFLSSFEPPRPRRGSHTLLGRTQRQF